LASAREEDQQEAVSAKEPVAEQEDKSQESEGSLGQSDSDKSVEDTSEVGADTANKA
jgi:hypothetical protein